MITHIVFFRLKEYSPENVTRVKDMLLSMDGRVEMLRHLEVGIDLVRSERSYDLALVTKFDSMAALDAYQTHPYHAGQVIPLMKSVCSSIVAVDYSC